MSCACGGVRRAFMAGGWCRCERCGAEGHDEELRRASSRWWLRYNACAPLAVEQELASWWWRRGPHGRPTELKGSEWMADVVALQRAVSAAAPAPRAEGHWMGASLAALAAEAHLWRGEFGEAAEAAEQRLAFAEELLGPVDVDVTRWAKARHANEGRMCAGHTGRGAGGKRGRFVGLGGLW